MQCDQGLIHSIETFGTVDGPGIRMVVFFQGCPLRCLYCHNPDTWKMDRGNKMTVDEVLAIYERNRSFYERNGGITATGGEPLMQLGFLTSLFAEAKRRKIHTALDTSGWTYRREKDADYEELLSFTDLVLLDIKHSDPEGHIALTGRDQKPVLDFLSKLESLNIKTLIRHVSIPTITDSEEELAELGKIIAHYRNIVGLDVLPYHTMGQSKYEQLMLKYPLDGIRAMTKEEALENRKIIIRAYQEERKKMMRKPGE